MATVNIPIPKAVTAYPLYDARLLPTKPSYAVTLGGSAVAAMKQSTSSNTQSQLAWIANISSLDTIIDRRVLVEVSFNVQFTATLANGSALQQLAQAGTTAIPTPLFQHGRHFGIAAYPFHSMISSATVGVNNTTTIFNASACLPFALRLQDSKRARVAAPTQSKLDTLASYAEGGVGPGASASTGNFNIASPYGGYDTAPYAEDPNNGAVTVQFVIPTGTTATATLPAAVGAVIPSTDPAGTGSYTVGTQIHTFISGQPVIAATAVVTLVFTYCVQITTVEELQISPWTQGVFAAEYESGLTGVSNTTLTLQMTTPDIARLIVPLDGAWAITGVVFGPTLANDSTWKNAFLHINTLNAPLSLEVPTTCVVPYHSMTPYVTTPSVAIPVWAGDFNTVSSQTLSTQSQVLPQIPDFLVIAAPVNLAAGNFVTRPYYCPIQRVSITFNGQNGLLTNISKYQLWNMSRINGLNMSWVQWRGHCQMNYWGVPTVGTLSAGGVAGTNLTMLESGFFPPVGAFGAVTRTSGGFLLLRMGTDIPLPANLAAGVQGSYSIQADVTVENWANTGALATLGGGTCTPTLIMVSICSGYLTTDKGAASTNTAPLNTSDVLAAQTGAGSGGDARSHSQVSRAWGGSSGGALSGMSTSMGMGARMTGGSAISASADNGGSAAAASGGAPGSGFYGSGALSAVGTGVAPYGASNDAYAGAGKRRRRGGGPTGQGAWGQGAWGQGAYGAAAYGQGMRGQGYSGGRGGDEEDGDDDDGGDDLRYLTGAGGGGGGAEDMSYYM